MRMTRVRSSLTGALFRNDFTCLSSSSTFDPVALRAAMATMLTRPKSRGALQQPIIRQGSCQAGRFFFPSPSGAQAPDVSADGAGPADGVDCKRNDRPAVRAADGFYGGRFVGDRLSFSDIPCSGG